MISDAMSSALSEQYTRECYSSYMYMSMASYFTSCNLDGCAHWLKIQAREEAGHAMIVFNYLCDQGCSVGAGALAAPAANWASPLEVMKEVLTHERKLSGHVHKITDLALKEGDHTTHNFLQWFIEEQLEEEASVSSLLGKFKLCGGEGAGLLLIDSELKTRTYVLPTALAGSM